MYRFSNASIYLSIYLSTHLITYNNLTLIILYTFSFVYISIHQAKNNHSFVYVHYLSIYKAYLSIINASIYLLIYLSVGSDHFLKSSLPPPLTAQASSITSIKIKSFGNSKVGRRKKTYITCPNSIFFCNLKKRLKTCHSKIQASPHHPS